VSPQVRIRHGEPGDLSFVFDLGRRTLESSVSPLRPAPPAQLAAMYERTIGYVLTQPHTILIAEENAERLGFIIGLDEIPDEVSGVPQAFFVYAAVEKHAQRRGIGRRLFTSLEDEARARGLSYASFMVTEENIEARELYAQLGYVTERRQLCKRL